MSEIITITVTEQLEEVNVTVTQITEQVAVTITEMGMQGPPGADATMDTLTLTVVADGQTVFNIFTMPTGYHELDINGIVYYQNEDYVIEVVGLNTQLRWLQSFILQITDKLIFKKY